MRKENEEVVRRLLQPAWIAAAAGAVAAWTTHLPTKTLASIAGNAKRVMRCSMHLQSQLTAHTHAQKCFLWYTNALFSRATGGQQGLQISRLGPGLDNKAYFVRALEQFERTRGCARYQVYPPTIDLNNSLLCASFYSNNSRWAPSSSSLWFMKKERGSTGRHVRLKRRSDIEREAAGALAGCNNGTHRAGSIASLEVPNLWVIDDRKWDHRVYVLVASIRPYVLLFRPGHLRFSALNYSDGTRDNSQRSARSTEKPRARARTGVMPPNLPRNPKTSLAQRLQRASLRKAARSSPALQGRKRGATSPTRGAGGRLRQLEETFGEEAWGAHVTEWLALAAKRKRQRLQGNATKGLGVVRGGGGRSQDDAEVARHVTNPRFGVAHACMHLDRWVGTYVCMYVMHIGSGWRTRAIPLGSYSLWRHCVQRWLRSMARRRGGGGLRGAESHCWVCAV